MTSLHRPPAGDPDAVRVVTDGFRLSTFLFAPLSLLAARLWIAFVVWFVLVTTAVLLVAAGTLSPGAAMLAVAILHLGFALDLAAGERRRLQRGGWTTVALSGPLGLHNVEADQVAREPSPPPTGATASLAQPQVLGLFPDRS